MKSPSEASNVAEPRYRAGSGPEAVEVLLRDGRQAEVLNWCRRTFGDLPGVDPLDIHQRALRFLEEAVELCQAVGLPDVRMRQLVVHVCARPPGEIDQEVGGVMVTLMAFAQVLGVSVADAECTEVARVLSKSPEHFRRRQEEKRDAGF